jgi:hypothetical protein
MYHKRLNLPKGKNLTKSLSWLCFFVQGEKRDFTSYNQGVKLLIRGHAKRFFVPL